MQYKKIKSHIYLRKYQNIKIPNLYIQFNSIKNQVNILNINISSLFSFSNTSRRLLSIQSNQVLDNLLSQMNFPFKNGFRQAWEFAASIFRRFTNKQNNTQARLNRFAEMEPDNLVLRDDVNTKENQNKEENINVNNSPIRKTGADLAILPQQVNNTHKEQERQKSHISSMGRYEFIKEENEEEDIQMNQHSKSSQKRQKSQKGQEGQKLQDQWKKLFNRVHKSPKEIEKQKLEKRIKQEYNKNVRKIFNSIWPDQAKHENQIRTRNVRYVYSVRPNQSMYEVVPSPPPSSSKKRKTQSSKKSKSSSDKSKPQSDNNEQSSKKSHPQSDIINSQSQKSSHSSLKVNPQHVPQHQQRIPENIIQQQQPEIVNKPELEQQYPQQEKQQISAEQKQNQLQIKIIEDSINFDSYERQLEMMYLNFLSINKKDTKSKESKWKDIYKRTCGTEEDCMTGSEDNNKSNDNLFQSNDDSNSNQIDGNQMQNQQNESQDPQYQLWLPPCRAKDSFLAYQSQFSEQQLRERQSQELYDEYITRTLELKYSQQLIEYPTVTYEEFNEIRKLWQIGNNQPDYIVKTLKSNFLPKLSAHSFRTLSIGTWLNDEIINGYLQMVDNMCIAQNKPYRVLNSFFAQTTFAKPIDTIKRALKRKNITPQNIIIIAINTGAHWLFAKIDKMQITIYDSLIRGQASYNTLRDNGSLLSGAINNIKKFATVFYGNPELTLAIDYRYPQQRNTDDCGMFVLCGIKDIVRDYKEWSFDGFDIDYKRFQCARELLNERLECFN